MGLSHQREAEMLTALLGAIVLSLLTEPPKVMPEYACSGMNPDGTLYEISLAVRQEGKNYFLDWSSRGTEMVGLGLRQNDQLAVVILNKHDNSIGVVLYTVKQGQLEGLWTFGGGQVFKEACLAKNSVVARR